jgi:hypothetical protein
MQQGQRRDVDLLLLFTRRAALPSLIRAWASSFKMNKIPDKNSLLVPFHISVEEPSEDYLKLRGLWTTMTRKCVIKEPIPQSNYHEHKICSKDQMKWRDRVADIGRRWLWSVRSARANSWTLFQPYEKDDMGLSNIPNLIIDSKIN